MRLVFLLVIAGLWTPVATRADLVWEKPRQETTAPLPGTESRVPFVFQNTGSAPVTIESVSASCSCLRTELSNRSIAPGERGTLTAILRTVGLPASRTARIELTTAEAPSRPYRVELHIVQPAPVTLEPAILWWNANTPLSPQTAILRVPKGTSVRIVPPAVAAPFEATLEGGPGEESFRVTVLPASTAKPAEACLPLEYTRPGGAAAETRTLFLRIHR
jgi:hypothetical protein